MGSTKIGKGGNGKIGKEGKGKYGYPGGGEIVSIDLEKETAVYLFLALAQALHYPTGKKKGKKKNGKIPKNGKIIPKPGKGSKVGYGVYTGTKGAKGYTATGTKGTKGSTGTKGKRAS